MTESIRTDWLRLTDQETARLILLKPKHWNADTLVVYRQVESDIQFGLLFADGDSVNDWSVWITHPKLDELGRLIFSSNEIESPPYQYRNANQVMLDGWLPWGYYISKEESNEPE